VWTIVPPAYRLISYTPLDLKDATQQVIFRELGKLVSASAQMLEQTLDHLEQILRDRILAMVYLQLFSPQASYYLNLNRNKLSETLLYYRSKFPTIEPKVRRIVDDTMRDYHLRELVQYIGPLQFLQVVETVFPAGLDYI
jgi:hypothetical protein